MGYFRSNDSVKVVSLDRKAQIAVTENRSLAKFSFLFLFFGHSCSSLFQLFALTSNAIIFSRPKKNTENQDGAANMAGLMTSSDVITNIDYVIL